MTEEEPTPELTMPAGPWKHISVCVARMKKGRGRWIVETQGKRYFAESFEAKGADFYTLNRGVSARLRTDSELHLRGVVLFGDFAGAPE